MKEILNPCFEQPGYGEVVQEHNAPTMTGGLESALFDAQKQMEIAKYLISSPKSD